VRRAGVLCVCLGVAIGVTGVSARGDTPLIEAVKQGNINAVSGLLAKGEIDAAEADGTTALHWAVVGDNGDLVRMLLRAGADPNAANRYGVTPLQAAAVNGTASITGMLAEAGADVNAVLPEGETVLMTAARTGNTATVELLLERGADIDARERWYGESALMWAAAENHPGAVRVLLRHGAEMDSRSAVQELENRRHGQSVLPLGGWTPMMYAARQGALDAGRVLAEAGADLDAIDPDGATALVIAIINANYDFAGLLLGTGADPNVVDSKAAMGPLYAAIDMHRLAVGHGRPNPRSTDALDSVDLVRLLLERGADPNAGLLSTIMQRHHTGGDGALGKGATPLMRAAKSGDGEVMQLLLAAGADPMATLPNGATALMFASGLGWRNGSPAAPSYDQGSDEDAVAAIDLLLERGLDVNGRDTAGNTPLHAAVTGRGSAVIVKALLDRGADVRARNARGVTPLEAARSSRSDRTAIAEILQAVSGPDASEATLTSQDRIAIQQLVAQYPYALDTGQDGGRTYANLFAEDGEFVSPAGTITGRAALADFANAHRPGQGPLAVRNFAANLLIEPSATGATGTQYGVVISFGEGDAPSSIFTGGHFEDVYVRTADGWRVRRREFVPSRGGAR
jgi:ankyrin repeat protein